MIKNIKFKFFMVSVLLKASFGISDASPINYTNNNFPLKPTITKFDINVLSKNKYMLINSNNWMGNISNTTKLNNIVLPGSHDAGMSQTNHCTVVVANTDWVQAQDLNILNQANIGSRYFDIRLDYDHDELVTYHRGSGLGFDGVGCNGQIFANNDSGVLDNAINFLKDNPTETLILKLSHTRSDSGHSAVDTVSRVVKVLNSSPYNEYLYKSNSDINLADLQIEQVRGKMIVVLDSEYNSYINPTEGLFKYSDYNPSVSDGLQVYDNYTSTDKLTKMHDDQLKKLSLYGGLKQNDLFLLSWTLTGEVFQELNIKELADEANNNLLDLLKYYSSNIVPNIIYIDYINPDLTKNIIKLNKF